MNPGPFIIIKLERKLKWWLEPLFDPQRRDANHAFLGTADGQGPAWLSRNSRRSGRGPGRWVSRHINEHVAWVARPSSLGR